VNSADQALGLTPFATNQSRHAFQWMQLPDLFELSGRTVGIVGFGEIGSEVAIRANAFGMRVLYSKRRRLAVTAESELSVEWYDLESLLSNSDFVVLSLPYSPAVHHLVGEKQLALMKPTSYLVNVARGPLVDERALARALSDGQIAGAGLDVFELEPWVRRDELATHRRTVLTPHIGGGSGGAREKQLSDVLNGVVQYMSTRSASVSGEEQG
jgi:phosphoglycerate dehydrogenase-like enzyme